QRLRNLTVHPTTDDATFCFSKHVPAEHSPTGQADTVIVVVNLDPHASRESLIHLDTAALDLGEQSEFTAHDELSGESYAWGAVPFVRLDPHGRCAHILDVRRR
ncbi:MAG TPA: alpha-1,4-glucan--maltose-1-phosphate maltosyltransferase, partial [Candidatus Ruania gallistercoris]|nr:alpha-1,4-glucan--maltose-1-phosphate maltosyltransferase [Candidatus Ruania gallistercoris]